MESLMCQILNYDINTLRKDSNTGDIYGDIYLREVINSNLNLTFMKLTIPFCICKTFLY